MLRFILGRIALLPMMLLGVSAVVFVMLRLGRGDPALDVHRGLVDVGVLDELDVDAARALGGGGRDGVDARQSGHGVLSRLDDQVLDIARGGAGVRDRHEDGRETDGREAIHAHPGVGDRAHQHDAEDQHQDGQRPDDGESGQRHGRTSDSESGATPNGTVAPYDLGLRAA